MNPTQHLTADQLDQNLAGRPPRAARRGRRGIALALAVTLVGVLAPTARADAAPAADQLTRTVVQPRTPHSTPAAVDHYLLFVAESAGQMWSDDLAAQGVAWQQVTIDIVDGNNTATGACGTVGDIQMYPLASPAFYCKLDNAIYLSSQWLAREIPDQFGLAFAVSHEMVHAAQHMVGNEEQPKVPVRPWELQADCGAGVWFRVSGQSGEDATRAAAVAEMLGDEDTGDAHHGTPTERRDAFAIGYNFGSGAGCPLDVGA